MLDFPSMFRRHRTVYVRALPFVDRRIESNLCVLGRFKAGHFYGHSFVYRYNPSPGTEFFNGFDSSARVRGFYECRPFREWLPRTPSELLLVDVDGFLVVNHSIQESVHSDEEAFVRTATLLDASQKDD